nr:hypothetical protein [Planococcus glaciei]
MLMAVLVGMFGRSENVPAEELALMAQNGDDTALHHLLQSYSPFMKKLLPKYANDLSTIMMMNTA